MARRESSTLRINVEIKDRDVAIFNARLGEMETKAGSASGAVDRTSGSIKKAGQSSAATAVHFQTMTQGMLNLATTGAQVFTSMSNLDRAANRLAMAQVGLARAQDLYNNKEIRLQDLRKRGEGTTKKAIQLEKELGTAKADLAVKSDKLRIEEGALNDVRILFATNIANVMVSSLQTIKTMKDLNIASTIKLAVSTRVLNSTFVQTGILGKAMVVNMTATGAVGMKAAAGIQLLTLRLRTLLVTLGPIAAGFVTLSVAYQAFEEDWGGFGTALKNTFPFLRDLTALQDEAKDSIDNWAGANNDLADTYDNMEGKARKSLTKINQMQADFLKQQLASQDRANYEAYLDKIAEFGGGTPQGFTTGSSGLPEQSKGTIGNIPNVPSLLGGGILVTQHYKEEGFTIQDIVNRVNDPKVKQQLKDYATLETPEANIPTFIREMNKITLSQHPELISELSWRGSGVTGLADGTAAKEVMQGGGYGQDRKAGLEQFIKNKMDQREHIMDFRGITNPYERMFVKQHGYVIRDGQRFNFPEVMRMNAAIEMDIRELERINYLVPDQDYSPSDPTQLRDHFNKPSTNRFLTGDRAVGIDFAASIAHQPRRVFGDRINEMFGDITGSEYDTSIASRLLNKMSAGNYIGSGVHDPSKAVNFRINKATGEIIPLPSGINESGEMIGALGYAKAIAAGLRPEEILSGNQLYGLKSRATQLAEHEARKKDLPLGARGNLDMSQMYKEYGEKFGGIYSGTQMELLRQILGGGEEASQNQMFAYKQITQNSINVIKINSDGKQYVSSSTTARANRSMAAAQALGRATWGKEQAQNQTIHTGGSGIGIVNTYVKNAVSAGDREAMTSLGRSHDQQLKEAGEKAFDSGRKIDMLWLRKQTENQARALSASIGARVAAERATALQFGNQLGISQNEALQILRDNSQGEQTLNDMLAYQQRLDAMSSGVV